MGFGPPLAGTGTDPLFLLIFGLATLCNLVPVLLGGVGRVGLAAVAGAHVLLLLRLAIARGAAARQRPADLERFQRIRDGR
jgi:hypothetical protein